MFLFEQVFNTALSGIAPLMSTITTVAFGILLASLLFSVYEAWVRGSDTRALGVAGIKYLAIGLLLANNGAFYDTAFKAVLDAFNQMAHAMAGAGPTDVFRAWFGELRNGLTSLPTVLNVITGVQAGLLSFLLLLVAATLFPVAYSIFTILYCLFGTILYTTGPLILALFPTQGLGTIAKRYAVNVVVFAGWGLLYGIFCRLVIAINLNSMAAITGAGNIMGLMTAATSEVLLAIVSILFSVCILLIPFLAKRIVEGDLGSSMLAVLGTAAAVTQSLAALAAGSSDGFGRTASSLGGGGGGGGKGTAALGTSGSGGIAPSGPEAESVSAGSSGGGSNGSRSPSGPSGGGRSTRPGSIPHAIGWLSGAVAALAVQGGRRAFQAGSGLVSGGAAADGDAAGASAAPPATDVQPVDERV